MTDPDHDSRAPDQPRPDGGTATGADETTLDPWGSSTVDDYRNLFEEFGIEAFDDVLPGVPTPHYLMRRGIIFGHRGYGASRRAAETTTPSRRSRGSCRPATRTSATNSSSTNSSGTKNSGADSYGLIADLEAHSARGLSWAEIDEHARDYLLCLIALGFDPEDGELYRQSTTARCRTSRSNSVWRPTSPNSRASTASAARPTSRTCSPSSPRWRTSSTPNSTGRNPR